MKIAKIKPQSLFCKPQQRDFDLYFKNKFLLFLLDIFHLNPSLSFFLDLPPDIVYKKAATTPFWYLVRFKLNLLRAQLLLLNSWTGIQS